LRHQNTAFKEHEVSIESINWWDFTQNECVYRE